MAVVFYLVYVPLQILWLPFTIVASMVVAYRQIKVSAKLDVSGTAIEILNGRYTMHVFGMRDDQASADLAWNLPNTSAFALNTTTFPMWLATKIAGGNPMYPRVPPRGDETMLNMVMARTMLFDQIIEQALPEVAHFVAMGAGMDTRAIRVHNQSGARPIELDIATTQNLKLTTYEKAGTDTVGVEFYPIDFRHETTSEVLARVDGYDAAKPSIFLWEGVTLYLSERDVRKTMRDLKLHAAPGSRLVADFYASTFVAKLTKMSMGTLEETGESLHFSVDFTKAWEEHLRAFVESEGLLLTKAEFMGYKADGGPYMVVAEITVPN